MCLLPDVCRIGGQQLKWGTVECAHTHITRSDYLEKLVSRQKMEWVGVLSQHVLQGPRDKGVEVEADWKV